MDLLRRRCSNKEAGRREIKRRELNVNLLRYATGKVLDGTKNNKRTTKEFDASLKRLFSCSRHLRVRVHRLWHLLMDDVLQPFFLCCWSGILTTEFIEKNIF